MPRNRKRQLKSLRFWAVARLLGTMALLFFSRTATATTATTAPPTIQKDWSALRTLLRNAPAKGQAPEGILLLLHQGRLVLNEEFGPSSPSDGPTFSADSPCYIQALSQPVLSVLIARLATKGALDLDRPIDAWLPAFQTPILTSGRRARRAPTLAELLSHTSGLPTTRAPFDDKSTLEKVLHALAQNRLIDEPGQTTAYSEHGYTVAAGVIEMAMGRSLEDVLQKELAIPLGLRNTTYAPSAEQWAAMPPIYLRKNHQFMVAPAPDRPAPGAYRPPGSAMIASPRDLAAIVTLLRNRGQWQGKPFLARAIAERLRVETPGGINWGLGVQLRGQTPSAPAPWIEAEGDSGVYLWLDFRRDWGGVVATQFPAGIRAPGFSKEGAKEFIDRSVTEIDRILGAPAIFSKNQTSGKPLFTPRK